MQTERKVRKSSPRTFWLAGLLVLFAVGCSSVREVPFTVTSDPPGSYILLQTLHPDKDMYDWIYLGTTPLGLVRPMNFRELKKTETVIQAHPPIKTRLMEIRKRLFRARDRREGERRAEEGAEGP